MLTLSFCTAFFVGFVHSLAPGHWLPVVLMAKAKKWSLKKAMLGAAITGAGHILFSNLIGLFSIWLGLKFLADYETQIEKYASLGLGGFGIVYATLAYRRHSSCHGHTHHPNLGNFANPALKGQKRNHLTPYIFLFSLGLSPCIAVIPVFAAAATNGPLSIAFTLVSFSIGVLASLISSTWLISRGILNLDHPLFEHYGDVITGCGVALMGIILYFIPM